MSTATKECIRGDESNSDDNSETSFELLADISDNNEDSEPEVNIIYNSWVVKQFAYTDVA